MDVTLVKNQEVREKSTYLVVDGGGIVTFLRANIGTLKVPYFVSLKCPIVSFLNIKSLEGNTREQEYEFSMDYYFGKVQYFESLLNVLKGLNNFRGNLI